MKAKGEEGKKGRGGEDPMTLATDLRLWGRRKE
jgi:hypothetical protein